MTFTVDNETANNMLIQSFSIYIYIYYVGQTHIDKNPWNQLLTGRMVNHLEIIMAALELTHMFF